VAEVEVVFHDGSIDLLGDTREARAIVDRLAGEAVRVMKFLTPVSPVDQFHRSGNLRSSIHAFPQPNGDIQVGPTADYARYVNDDTVPHIIESHGPWSLHNRATGQYFGRIVHHPGTHGKHFIEKTADSFDGRREYA
jgi:hypothetical protein